MFGEFTWHATDALNVTFGGRWFENTNEKVYIKYIAGGTDNQGRATGGFIQPRWQGNDIVASTTLTDFVPKLSIDYAVSDNKMLYGLYSEGYRVGGINRVNKNADWSRTLWGQEWEPDLLKNYELGLRSRWADNTVQMNLTGFYMTWEDFQVQVVDPSSGRCIDIADATIPGDDLSCTSADSLPWVSIVGNVGDAEITGLSAEVDWVPADRWSVAGNLQWLATHEITGVSSDPRANLFKGMELPGTPELQGALWGTYNWPVQFIPGGEMFLRGQLAYVGETNTRLIPSSETNSFPSFTNDSYTIVDFRWGLVSSDGGWQIDLFVDNVTDERAQVSQGGSGWQWGRTGEYGRSHNVYTVRPREIGMRFFARWGD